MFIRECLWDRHLWNRREGSRLRRKEKQAAYKESPVAWNDPMRSSGAETVLQHCAKPGWNGWALKPRVDQLMDVSCLQRGVSSDKAALCCQKPKGCLLTVPQVAGTRSPSAKGNLSGSSPRSFPVRLPDLIVHMHWGVASLGFWWASPPGET